MQRCVLAVCLAALGTVSAYADPMPIFSRSFQTDVPAAAPPPPLRLASNALNLGGGFIEALFGGPARGVPDGYYGRDQYTPAQPYANEPRGMAEPAHPEVDARFRRQMVKYDGREKAGTVIINTQERLLYLVQGDGTAVRYGIGVGRPGFSWSGVKTVSAKREWPDWRPPSDMLRRRPDLPRYMPGGPDNPLGARAMYLGSSLYRIHGSNEPWTIGQAVSSGCIRMRNEDVVDLYERVKVGTKVIVI